MDKVQVVYALQEFADPKIPSIFLAGPTPRKSFIKPWRPRALQLIRHYHRELVVYYPEPVSADKWNPDADDHLNWRRTAMLRAQIIFFWVDRKLDHMPGFRTNTDWGFWVARDPDRLVIAYPQNTTGMRGMHNDALYYDVPYAHSLASGINIAVEKVFSTR